MLMMFVYRGFKLVSCTMCKYLRRSLLLMHGKKAWQINTLIPPTPPEEHPRSLLRKKGTASLRQADNARTIFFVAVGGALYA